jgi:hypothetical protein
VVFHAGKPLNDTLTLVKLAPAPRPASKPTKPVDRNQSVNPFGD